MPEKADPDKPKPPGHKPSPPIVEMEPEVPCSLCGAVDSQSPEPRQPNHPCFRCGKID